MSHRYLVLGLLADCPRSGYDIRKHVQDELSTVTNASYGTLYPTLHRLLEEGAVRVEEVIQDSRPPKKIYHLTEQGKTELRVWLQEPPAADKIKREFLLKLYLAKDWSDEQVRGLLEERRAEMLSQIDALSTERGQTDSARRQWIIDYALSIYRAELDWLAHIEEQLDVA